MGAGRLHQTAANLNREPRSNLGLTQGLSPGLTQGLTRVLILKKKLRPKPELEVLPADYWVITLTLSTTNEVCSDESSFMANDSVTVWPLYGSRLKLRIW